MFFSVIELEWLVTTEHINRVFSPDAVKASLGQSNREAAEHKIVLFTELKLVAVFRIDPKFLTAISLIA